jgi:hypothetical protein
MVVTQDTPVCCCDCLQMTQAGLLGNQLGAFLYLSWKHSSSFVQTGVHRSKSQTLNTE